MKLIEKNNSVLISGVRDFNLIHTFMCGQCFRWEEEKDGFYGIAKGRVIFVKSISDDEFEFINTTTEEFNSIWYDYFDFGTDYGKIKAELSVDENLKKAVEFGGGIRLLNQDPFECLISFIASTQNSIPRIKKIIAKMSSLFGDELSFNGKKYYAFPTCDALSVLDESDLAPLKVGYRAEYIIDAARKVKNGEVDIYNLHNYSFADARRELLKIKGVGPKVADCVLLFSLKKREAFPIDVWIGRIMRLLYLGENASMKDIVKFRSEKFSSLAGFAQQYLFYYARENNLTNYRGKYGY